MESVFSLACATLVFVSLGMASYRWLETPFQARGAAWAGGQRKALLAGGVLVFLVSLGFRSVAHSNWLSLSVTTDRVGSVWQPDSRGFANRLLSPGPAGRSWSDKRLFVFGDSHAGAYVEMLRLLRDEKGVSIYLNSTGGGQIGSLLYPQAPGDDTVLAGLQEDLDRYGRPGDIVLLASLRVRRLCNQWGNFDLKQVIEARDSPQAETERRIAVREGQALVRSLESRGFIVVIDAPKPIFAAPPFRCSDWFNKNNPIGRPGFLMERSFLLNHRSAAMRSIEEIRQDHPGVKMWDPLPILCPGEVCSAFDGDKPLFFDGDHLSAHGSRKLYPDFAQFLGMIWEPAAGAPGRQ
jgi:hypothetical protein